MSHISMDLLWIKLFCRLDSFERMSLYQSHLFETAYVQDVFNQPFSSWIQDSFCTLLNIFNPNSLYYLRLMKLPNGISKSSLCLWRNAYDSCVTYCFRCVWKERLSFYSTRFQTFLFHNIFVCGCSQLTYHSVYEFGNCEGDNKLSFHMNHL